MDIPGGNHSIDDNVSETIYIQTCIPSNQITEKDTSSTSNLEITGEVVKKNLFFAINSNNVSSTEGTERKPSFHASKPDKEIVATLDEADSITGHGPSNESIQVKNMSLIQTVGTCSLTFEPENYKISSELWNPGQSLIQTPLLNTGKRQEKEDSVGRKIIQELNISSTQSESVKKGQSHILSASEKVELNNDHSTSGALHESKSLSSALKQEQATAGSAEKDAPNTSNFEKRGEAVKKNLFLAMDSPSTESTERQPSFHSLKPDKEIVATLDEEDSITGHGYSNEGIQLRNTLLIQTVGTSSLTFQPENHEIGGERRNPGQSLIQTPLPNTGKRQEKEDLVGKKIIQELNVFSTQSESAGKCQSDICAPEKVEIDRDRSTSGVFHGSEFLSSALKQEQVTAGLTEKDASNTSNLEKRGEVKKNLSLAIDSPNVSSTEGTERKPSFHASKPDKEIVATIDEEDSITGHGPSNEIIQLRNTSLIQTFETCSLIFEPENHEIGSECLNPGQLLVQKPFPISGKTPEKKESVEKITLVPDVSSTQPVGCNSKDAAVAIENLVNAKLSEKNSVGMNNLLSSRSAEIDPPPTDQKPSYCVLAREKQITEQSTSGPAEQVLDETIFEQGQIDGINCNDTTDKDIPVPDSQLLNRDSPSNSKLISDDDFDEIAFEKLMIQHMQLSKICQQFDEFLSIHTSDFDMIVEPQVYEKRNWTPPEVGMQDDHNRRITFNGRRNTNFNADDFSQGGFYLSYDDIVECYSCQARHRIDDVTSAPGTYRYHHRRCQHLQNIRSRRNEPELVESDGRVSDDIADPPGQQSLYIPSGDIRREAYRLSTFEHFPVTCRISGRSLAKSGFLFTGFYDRVKCFACARTVERWEETDDPAQRKWHKPTCPFPKGEECGNVSLLNLFQAITPVVPAAVSLSSAAQSTNQFELGNITEHFNNRERTTIIPMAQEVYHALLQDTEQVGDGETDIFHEEREINARAFNDDPEI